MSRTSRALRTLATGFGSYGVSMGLAVVTTPLLLSLLGQERYGGFRAASDWLGYVGLLEFGVGGALQAMLARSLGTVDRQGVIATLRAGIKAYLLLAAAMVLAGAAMSCLLPALIRLPDELKGELWLGSVFAVLGFGFLPLATFRPLAEASQRGDLVNLLYLVQTVVATAATVLTALLGWGLVGQFAALFLASGAYHLGLACYGLWRYPELLRTGEREAAVTGGSPPLTPGADAPGSPDSERAVSRSLWSLSWPNLVFNLCSRVGLLTDNIVVAAFLGPGPVAAFYLSQRVLVLACTQVQALGGSTWAGLMDLHYRGEREVFFRRLAQVTRLTSILGVAALLPTAVWNRCLIALWVGQDQYAGEAITWLAAVNGWMLAVTSVWGWPLSAGGHARTVLPIVVASTTVNLVVSIAGTALFGVTGPLIGTCAGIGLVSWWSLLVALRLRFDVPAPPLLTAGLSPALLGIPYGLALLLIHQSVPAYDPAWPRWAGLMAVLGWLAAGAAGYLVAAWFLIVPGDFRQEWVGRFRGWFLVRAGEAAG